MWRAVSTALCAVALLALAGCGGRPGSAEQPETTEERATQETGAVIFGVDGEGAATKLALYANGKKVAETDDPEGLPAGAAGVVVASVPDRDNEFHEQEALFDNFVVMEP